MPDNTILIAEDNADDAFLLKRAFLKAGINARLNFVRDGQEAVDYLKGEGPFHDRGEHPLPKLLLLDLKMPKLGGFDVLQWVRSEPGLKRLPVTVLSASHLQQDVDRAFDLGANSYVVKPADFDHLAPIAAKLHDYWLRLNATPQC